MKDLFLICCITAGMLLSGCQLNSTADTEEVVSQAKARGYVKTIIPTSEFRLTSFAKLREPGQDLVVYIEGDGHSRVSKVQVSDNPTPHKPLALQLALLDKRPNVLYLARPCQYTPLKSDSSCTAKYWSTHRFAPEVIASTSQAISKIKRDINARGVHIVGFSGGASVAALVAARRYDVKSFMSVAGDLNHTAMSKYHRATPLVHSLNPIDVAKEINHIPQVHFVGKKDKVVPVQIAQGFQAASKSDCVKVMVVDAGHHKGWASMWPQLVAVGESECLG